MEKGEKIVAVIQARMNSKRLPGKVLMELEQKPMLWHIVNRLKFAKLIDLVAVATTTQHKDNAVLDCCLKYDIPCYRGSENDVLDRFYKAAQAFGADVIVRVTGDCPLIDPVVVDKVISSYLKKRDRLDGSSNVIKRTYPRGLDVEVLSYAVLKRLLKKASKNYHREHVTTYIYEHPNIFKIASVENDLDLSHLRWTVDEESDFRFIEQIYIRLYHEGGIFYTDQVYRLLKKEPQLQQINRSVKQKAVDEVL